MAMRGSAWLFLFWLALATSSLVHQLTGDEGSATLSLDPGAEENKKEAIAQDEIAELANAVKVNLPKKLQDVPIDTGSRAWGMEAKALVEAVEKLHRELTERNLQLRVKQLTPPDGKDEAPYGHVKGMLIKEDNTPYTRIPNAESCELKCSLDVTCKAFSYNVNERECLISKVALGYDPDSTFYAKNGANGGFSMYPGMTETSMMLGALKDKTKADCETDCSGNMNCKGYSYKKTKSVCTMTSEPLHYDAAWDYYEKPMGSHLLGDPFDVGTHKQVDVLSRGFTKFWNEHEYHSKVSDKKKIVSFQNKISALKDKTIQQEDQIRSLMATASGQTARASQLSRAVRSADTAVSLESDGLVEIKGRVERAKLSLRLEEDKVLTRQKLLEEEQPKSTEENDEDTKSIDEILQSDGLLNEAKEKVVTARQALTSEELDVQRRTKTLEDAKYAAVETNRQYIETMTTAKSTEEDVKSAKLGMQTLAVDAKELTKIVDREAKIVIPPPEAVEPPSLEHLLGWVTKNTKAEQNAKALEIKWMMSQGQGPPSPVDIPPEEPEVKSNK